MGNNICNSYQSTSVATVKLILEDGQLREFSQPVRVSQVLHNNSTSFVCDSDDMDFGEFISAVDDDEELQLGQLYFVLPLACLNRPVLAEELAALALKASQALRKLKGRRGPARCCGDKGVETLEFAIKKDVRMAETVGGYGGDRTREFERERIGRGRGRGRGGGRVERQRFVAELSLIVEEVVKEAI